MHWRAYVCTREKVRPVAQYHRENAKKFALCARIGPNSVFLCVLGEFFRGRVAGGVVLGEYFRAKRPCAGLGGGAAYFRLVAVGVLRHAKPFCGVSPACRSLAWRNSPPVYWRRGRDLRGVATKLQTHWAKSSKMGC